MDFRRFLFPLVALLLLLGIVAALAPRDDDDGEELTAGSDGTTTTAEETTTTTAPPTSTTAAPVTTTARPATTTTAVPTPTSARPATTTTAAATRNWSISPTSGPANSEFTAAGSGCTGQDAGVGITLYDPNGQAYNGTGAAAMADGTWRIPVNIGAVPPGRYTVKAACQGSSPFQYPQARIFTVTG